MKRTLIAALGLAALTAASAEAQVTNFPVFALPGGTPATWVGVGYGRGLNQDSRKRDAFGAFIGMTGLGGRASVSWGGAMIDRDQDAKYSFGGAVAVDVPLAAGSVNVAVQVGIGYNPLAKVVVRCLSPVTDQGSPPTRSSARARRRRWTSRSVCHSGRKSRRARQRWHPG